MPPRPKLWFGRRRWRRTCASQERAQRHDAQDCVAPIHRGLIDAVDLPQTLRARLGSHRRFLRCRPGVLRKPIEGGNVCFAPRTRIETSVNVPSAVRITGINSWLTSSTESERRFTLVNVDSALSRIAGRRPVACCTSAVTRSTTLRVRLIEPVIAGSAVAVCSTEAIVR